MRRSASEAAQSLLRTKPAVFILLTGAPFTLAVARAMASRKRDDQLDPADVSMRRHIHRLRMTLLAVRIDLRVSAHTIGQSLVHLEPETALVVRQTVRSVD